MNRTCRDVGHSWQNTTSDTFRKCNRTNCKATQRLYRGLKDYHVLVLTPHDEFDFNNPRHDDSKRFLELAQAAADYNTKHVKGRMLVGKHEKAMRGEYVGHR